MESVIPDSSEEVRNWSDLPPDVLSLILAKLGAIEILIRVQSVCSSWRKLCKEPQIWRSIDMQDMWNYFDDDDYDLEKIARHAVDRSCGQLVEFSMGHFGTDALLQYITDKSSPLRCLRLVSCHHISDEGLIEMARNHPLLEELQLCHCSFTEEALAAVGRLCPQLKSFRMNCSGTKNPRFAGNEEALAIAENMPGLRHLHLFGNQLTNDGLQAILDGCPHLESLDLRQCFNVNLGGDLGRRCAHRIRYLRAPNDSTYDYEFSADFYVDDGSFHEYDSGYSDVGIDYDSYDEFCDPFIIFDDSDFDLGDFSF